MFSLLRRLTWEDDLEGLDLPPKQSRAKKGNQLLIEKRISLSKSFPSLFGILGFYLLLILVLPGCLGKGRRERISDVKGGAEGADDFEFF